MKIIRQILLSIWKGRCKKVREWKQKYNITNKIKRDRMKWVNKTNHTIYKRLSVNKVFQGQKANFI